MTWVAFLWTYSILNACGGLDPGSQGEILVSQSPPYLRVTAGENVVMNCSFSLQSNVTSVFVEWILEEQKLIECQSESVGCHQPDTQEKIKVTVNWTSQFSTLHIRNIEPKDNGTYYCKIQVEKPVPIKRGSGNGTAVNVTKPEEASADSNHDLQTWLPLLLALGVVLCLLYTTYDLCKGKHLTDRREGVEREDAML
ncbi:uncharacterized protein LOC132396365 isoform X2 [Hypanus sabinus]|uniref:uncharacterized protein LOC132396365 isoform X2 n=1 Tax=Hypanus sabinus TaxID=79690 RepID=UPI0028C470CC|nr:uncharacterized protein LOC132396365 isoform X2 [Hypanus sabinus]